MKCAAEVKLHSLSLGANNHKPKFTRFLEYPQGLSDLSPKLAVVNTGVYGYGLAAKEDIVPGERLITFGGTLMPLNEYFNLPPAMLVYPHQVDFQLMFGPKSILDIGAAEMLNHSCEPNVGYEDSVTVISIRSIETGEEITIDYGFSESFTGYAMKCFCGAKNCRGVISCNDWQLPELQEKYLDYFQPYLKSQIKSQRVHNIVGQE